jgi:lipopolysaccharide/colanic/teichoic acid biosynthesis glycosyltransferase
MILQGFGELPVEGVQVRNLGRVLGVEYTNNLLRPQARWVKRTLDVLLAVPVGLLSAPVILCSALLVRIFSPGPAFFRHDREGRRGRAIRVPKLRTMTVDAERQIERLIQGDPGLRERWEEGFKLKDDPRIIPGIGRILRRFSIDELPQLWLVIKGDMSLVGPRPFPEYHLGALSAQARALRGAVRPGITGLWQISARGVADIEAQEAHDIYYVRNWSPWLDLYIVGKTLFVVLSGKGAY